MRPILYFNGIFLIVLSLCMVPSLMADLYFGSDDWLVFFACLMITAFFGGCLLLGNTAPKLSISRKEAFILTTTSWISVSIFGAAPFFISSLDMSLTNSLFESVSGLTTTGSTTILDLDHTPAGILLWRAMLQWLGGVAIIIMAISVLPFLKVGGMQVFRTELSTDDKALPRTTQRSKMILLVYTALTFFCTIGYMGGGMEVFDAIAHAMTTISTGGYSTSDQSFADYDNISLELIAIVFMILGALPFLLYLSAINGNLDMLIKDSQVRIFLALTFTVSILIFLYLLMMTPMPHLFALRVSLFNTVSIITGTGYFNTDYTHWSAFCTTMMLFLMVIGGCAGSTSGGIKIFRFQVLYAVILGQIKKLVYPHNTYIPNYNHRPLQSDIPISVMGFFFTYALCFLLLALGLASTGLDIMTSLSGAISAISNVGPGIGPLIGPGNTYQSLNDPAKWMLCIGMIVGRLELFMVLVMLSPHFWRN